MMADIKYEKSQLLDDFHLNEDGLRDEAKSRFPFHTEILKSLDLCGHRALSNQSITPAGKHNICSTISRCHQNVKNVLNYLVTTSSQTKEKINKVPMTVICGIPRCGTTLLHNLMACDPAGRAPLLTDMTVQPIPPILRSNVDGHKQRMETEADILAHIFKTAGCDFKTYEKNIGSAHALFAFEEDGIITRETGLYTILDLLVTDQEKLAARFADKENKDFSYDYHQAVLQMLHDVDPPRTHWQLKSPTHILLIDTLLKYYPRASLIMCHRRLDEAVPSWCAMVLAFNSVYFNDDDSTSLKILLKQAVTVFDAMLDSLIEFRSRQPSPKNVLDIQYEDLMRDPINTVRRIYDHFDFLQWSDEFEQAMRTWLVDNPQGKQGRHSYSIKEFGLEHELKKDQYEKYEKMFFPA